MKKEKLQQELKNYHQKIDKKLNEYASDSVNWRYTEAVITILATTFFIFFAIRPAVITIAGLIGEINEKREISSRMQQKINNIVSAQEEYALVQERRDLLESYLPSDFGISQGITQVGGISMDDNLPVSQMRLEEMEMANPKTDLSGIEFNFSTQGEYDQLKRLVEQIGLVRRWINIDNYQITVGEDDEAPLTQLKFNLKARFNYWFEGNYGED